MRVLVVVAGPTAVGKTALSLAIAQACGGEIVSADSRQVYRQMDIGTAKATPAERQLVPHHLIDIKEPSELISLGEYQQLANNAIVEIQAREQVPLLAGGTGQYVQAVVEGWQVPRVPPQPELRAELEELAQREGKDAVFARLAAVDPASVERIDYRNLRRVIRAIEVSEVSGRPFSDWQTKSPPPYAIRQIGLTRPRDQLYARADARIEQMFAQGFVAEVEGLLAAGLTPDQPGFSSLGYREVAALLAGEIDLDEAKMLIRRHTRQFIRRQYNWFSLSDPAITWFDLAETETAAIVEHVSEWLGGQAQS